MSDSPQVPPYVEHRFVSEPRLTLVLRGSISSEELMPDVVVSIYEHNAPNTPSWMVRGKGNIGLVAEPTKIPVLLITPEMYVADEAQAWELARKVYADLRRQRDALAPRGAPTAASPTPSKPPTN